MEILKNIIEVVVDLQKDYSNKDFQLFISSSYEKLHKMTNKELWYIIRKLLVQFFLLTKIHNKKSNLKINITLNYFSFNYYLHMFSCICSTPFFDVSTISNSTYTVPDEGLPWYLLNNEANK